MPRSMLIKQFLKTYAVVCLVTAMVAAPLLSLSPAAHAQNLTISTSQDCDTNAVIWCGAGSVSQLMSRYTNGDGHNSAASIQHIYSSLGISATDMASMDNSSTTVIAGKVTATGNVHDANDNVIATNATTAGRQNMPGSTAQTANGTAFFTRPPSASFQSSSLPAFVVMKNGQFAFAIIASCGNPVKATPKAQSQLQFQPTKANLMLSKLVAARGSTSFQKSVTAQSGDHVTFSIMVKNTGDPASDVNVVDQLPAHLTFVPGTLQHNGKASAGEGSFFSSGIATSNLSTETTFTFEAIVGATTDTAQTCTPETLTNTASMSANGLPNQTSTATVTKTCATQPTSTTPVAPTAQQQQQQQQQVNVNVASQPATTTTPAPAQTTPTTTTQPPAQQQPAQQQVQQQQQEQEDQNQKQNQQEVQQMQQEQQHEQEQEQTHQQPQADTQQQTSTSTSSTPVTTAPATTTTVSSADTTTAQTAAATPAPQPAAPAKTLVNTGPGNLIGLFLLVTVGSTVAYRYLLVRYLERQL